MWSDCITGRGEGVIPLPNRAYSRYLHDMNIKSPTTDAKLWHLPSEPTDTPVPGYEAWLVAEIAAGLAEVAAGKVTPLDEVRKEFGLE